MGSSRQSGVIGGPWLYESRTDGEDLLDTVVPVQMQ
jgi:hypothetical protein